jgi:hypothetical protein
MLGDISELFHTPCTRFLAQARLPLMIDADDRPNAATTFTVKGPVRVVSDETRVMIPVSRL